MATMPRAEIRTAAEIANGREPRQPHDWQLDEAKPLYAGSPQIATAWTCLTCRQVSALTLDNAADLDSLLKLDLRKKEDWR